MTKDEIPSDAKVIAIVNAAGENGISPSDVLMQLIAQEYSRADSQRAMQRVLDRGKITFNSTLNLVASRELVDG